MSLFLVVGFLFVVSPCSGFFDSKQLPSFSDLAEKASPAVVNISTVKVVQVSKRLRRFFFSLWRK